MWYERVATCFFMSTSKAKLVYPKVNEVVKLENTHKSSKRS